MSSPLYGCKLSFVAASFERLIRMLLLQDIISVISY